jgi:hypothetical protein
MPSSGTWHRVGLVRTDVSEESVAPIFRVEKIRKRRKALAVANRLNHSSEQTLSQ